MQARKAILVPTLFAVAAAAAYRPAAAQSDPDLAGEVTRLKREMAVERQRLEEQQRRLDQLEQRLLGAQRPQSPEELKGLQATGQPEQPGRPALAQNQPQPTGQPPEPREQRPEVPIYTNVGGVLNPKGRLTIEPSFEYANSQENRFFFSGAEIVNTVFIGGLDAVNARRNTLTAALTGRYGITDRLQTDLRVPFLYRSDREAQGVNTDVLNRSVEGHGLGDIEVAGHYQINTPAAGGAYYVGNLRFKTDTGTGPFDVPVTAVGQQARLPTGSGFLGVEPSLTVLFPSDPVVLFGNLGYTYNFDKNINKTRGPNTFGNVAPGGVLRGSFGLGFGINDKVAINLGYEHDWVRSTVSVINRVKTSSEELQVGQFLVGASYAFSPTLSANVNLAVGATRDAPDVRILLALPISFDLLK